MHNSEETKTINRIALHRAIQGLPRRQRDAVLYCEILGFTQAETGRVLGISQQAVDKNIRAAKKNIEARL